MTVTNVRPTVLGYFNLHVWGHTAAKRHNYFNEFYFFSKPDGEFEQLLHVPRCSCNKMTPFVGSLSHNPVLSWWNNHDFKAFWGEKMLFWNVQEAKIGPFHTEMWLTRPCLIKNCHSPCTNPRPTSFYSSAFNHFPITPGGKASWRAINNERLSGGFNMLV